MIKINRESGGYPWLCWSIAATVFFMQFGLLVFPSSISDQLKDSFSLSGGDLGFFYAAFLFTYVFMQIPVGLLFDRYSAKKLLMFSLSMMAVGCLFLIFSKTFLVGLLSRMLMGFGGSFAFIGVIYLSREWFSTLMFPVMVGLTEAMGGFSVVAFNSVFAAASKYQRWETTLAQIFVFLLIQIVLIKTLVSDRHEKVHYHHAHDTLIHHAKMVFKNSTVWWTALYVGFSFAHYMTLTSMWRLTFLKDRFHIPTFYAVFDNGLVILGFIIGGPLCGYLSRFFGDRMVMLAGAMLQLFFLLAAHYFKLPLWSISIVLFLLGVSTGAIALTFNVIKKEVPNLIYGMASGMINMFFGAFSIFLTPLLGYLYELSSHNVKITILPVIACSALAVFSAVILLKKRPKSNCDIT